MELIFILEQVLNGLLIGVYYLLIALGLSLIFSLGGIVNLAHGAFYAIGAYLAVLLSDRIGFIGSFLAAPVLDEPRYGGQPVYFSDVIVRRDSPCRSFAELRGRSWAHNVEDSYSGCFVTRYELHRMGESESFFGRVTFSGGHQESIRRVVAGEVEASAIDSHVLGVERVRDPGLAGQVRVVAVFGPSAIPPVVATANLPDDLGARVAAALAALGDDPASRAQLAPGMIRRYVPIADGAYDEMRRMLDAVERRPPPIRVPA